MRQPQRFLLAGALLLTAGTGWGTPLIAQAAKRSDPSLSKRAPSRVLLTLPDGGEQVMTRSTTPTTVGRYAILRVNGRTLPARDRIRSGPGWSWAGELREGYLTLYPNGRWQVWARYRKAYIPSVQQAWTAEADAETSARGTWTARSGVLTLTPDHGRGENPAPLVGTLRRGRLTLPLRYTGDVETKDFIVVARWESDLIAH